LLESKLKGVVTKQYQVIFHLDEEAQEKVQFVLNNIINLLNDLGDETVEVALLANGPAVKAFQTDEERFSKSVLELLEREVRIVLCNNALNLFDLEPTSMLAEATIVPSGVGELVRKQAEGWAYIRP